MWNKILNYVLGVALGVVLIFCIIYGVKYNRSEKQVTRLTLKLKECVDAPIQRDTIFDTVYIKDEVVIKPHPKPKPSDGQSVSPTPNTKPEVQTAYYSEVYKNKGITIHWEALTKFKNDSALIDYVKFSDVKYPKETITLTKTIHDTIPIETPAKTKSSFQVYGGAFADNVKMMPNLEAGIGYQFKNNWAITAGPMYVFDNNKLYLDIRFTFNFHK